MAAKKKATKKKATAAKKRQREQTEKFKNRRIRKDGSSLETDRPRRTLRTRQAFPEMVGKGGAKQAKAARPKKESSGSKSVSREDAERNRRLSERLLRLRAEDRAGYASKNPSGRKEDIRAYGPSTSKKRNPFEIDRKKRR